MPFERHPSVLRDIMGWPIIEQHCIVPCDTRLTARGPQVFHGFVVKDHGFGRIRCVVPVRDLGCGAILVRQMTTCNHNHDHNDREQHDDNDENQIL